MIDEVHNSKLTEYDIRSTSRGLPATGFLETRVKKRWFVCLSYSLIQQQ